MLYDFLTSNRQALIGRCRDKVALRYSPKQIAERFDHGIPRFIDQLIRTLRVEQTDDESLSQRISGSSGGMPAMSEIGETAALHGRELLNRGFTVEQVVHDYGDLCQAITELAVEDNAVIKVDEFRTLNRCLDNAIATAVTEFSYHRERTEAGKQVLAFNERLGFFAHELRNLIHSATLALSAIKAGGVGLGGATGAVLDRSLVGLTNLIDRSLAEVRMTAGLPIEHQLFSLSEFISDVELSASLEAKLKNTVLVVEAVDKQLAVAADRDLLLSAVGNLLQNAFKYTHPHSQVTLHAYAGADRILIEVADHCGGLPAGDAERMFLPFTQPGDDKSGLGLGLSISRRSVETNDGTLSVRDIPGSGCVFTIDLPRHAWPQPSGPSNTLQ
ncbi:MAG: HAMP domain-containing sensor histidine kinase [Betaproteobacteria bacterium]